MDIDPTTSEQAEPPRSFWSRWVGVYFSPGETFGDIARAPGFIPPLIVSIISGLVMTETMLFKVGMERIVRNAIEQRGGAGQLSAEQIDQAVQQGAKFGIVLTHVSALLGPPIFLAIVAALGLAIVNGIYGGQLDFKRSFSVACYANLINVIGVLMAVMIMFFGDPERFNPNNPMPSNPGFFLNPLETSKPLLAFAGSLDLFSFWLIALLGIGYSAASGGKAKAFSISAFFLGGWLIIALAKVAFELIM
ncbi:MAG: YIP1 family protein [Acidobacteria bacterium]|nr:YIP1 family protein [Acidobacteriota bacterium]